MNNLIKTIFILTAIELASCSTSKDRISNCSKCDVNLLTIVEENPSKANIKSFVCTLSIDCLNNVEFMEYYNEVLFNLLGSMPEETLAEIERVGQDKKELLLNIIKNPINDSIDVLKLKAKLLELKYKKNIKQSEFLDSLLQSLCCIK